MRKVIHGITALALSVCAGSAAVAQSPATAIAVTGAVAPMQWQPGPGWDRDIDVRCVSRDFRYSLCQVDTGRGSEVSLVRQISETRCVEGRNWGWNRAGIWVDQGCEGVFRVQRRWAGGPGQGHGPGHGPGHGGPGHGAGGWQPGPDWDRAIRVHCASIDYRYRMCQVDTGRGGDVRVERQISKTRCVRGQNWGWNRAGVWVDGGCEAVFLVERRWR
jgi:hypothetical protein